MYRIHQIKLGINEDLSVIPQRIKKVTGKPDMEITQWKIVKESLDARDKGDIKKVFTVDFASNMSVNCDPAPDMRYQPIIPKHKPKQSPVIIGFGPCGIFAALILSQAGFAPIVLERGKSVEERSKDVETYWEKGILNPESNVQFGEGGAGTFSDGKLTTGIKDPRMRKVLEVLAHSGGGEEILTKQKPHIGTDVLKVVVSNIRKEIINNGGSVRFESKVSEILTENQKITGVKLADGEIIETDQVILAIGHSARDTVAMLNEKGVTIEQKPFSMGVRIQHAQEAINKAQYGKAELAKILGPADYKLSHHCKDGRGVYTFCMCPGGEIIMAASEENTIVTNGMSNNARDGAFANSGLLVDVRTSDFGSTHPLAGIEFQRKYERAAFLHGGGKAPTTLWKDFPTSALGKALPPFVKDAIIEAMPFLGRRLRGFDHPKALMVGVESRSSSPIRIIRDRSLCSNFTGLYPGGEGAGYAGGIVSAAVDGIRIAEEIIKTEV